jgi:thymidylate kinase
MTTQRVAITGTDGTGKTTVVRLLGARFQAAPGTLRAFRAPQYHEDADLPFAGLSAAIDELSMLADRLGDPLLKTAALFLSMTLYGDVERFLASAYRPRWLVAERQCLADSLTYARFYLPLLKGPLDRAKLEGPVREALGKLGPDAFARLEAWLPIFQARLQGPEAGAPASFWELPLYVRALFSAPPDELLPRLQAAYHAELPDHVVLLTVRPEALAGRLAQKKGAAGEVPREIHEQSHVLAMFQEGLQASCAALRARKPDLAITTLDTSEETPETTVERVLEAIGAPR